MACLWLLSRKLSGMKIRHITSLFCEHEVDAGAQLHKHGCQSGRKKVLSTLTGLWSEVAGYSELFYKLRYQSQALTHLCQNQLVQEEEKEHIRTHLKFIS